MEKLGKFLIFTAFLAVFIGIRMVAFQGQGALKIREFDLPYLSEVKKVEIDQLRELVKADVTHEYMLGNAFLLKWLLDQDFDVNQAAERIKQNMEWRAEQNMDTILEENWDDLKSVLPYSINTTDKFGRPVLYIDIGQWNMAKLISEQSNGTDRLERFFYMFTEEIEQRIRDFQAEGKNVTQSVSIINVGTFGIERLTCIQCLLLYRRITQVLPSNFPWLAERSLYVNVPNMFVVAQAYISDKTKRYMNMLGRDKSDWEATILETIDRDQIPSDLLRECHVNSSGI